MLEAAKSPASADNSLPTGGYNELQDATNVPKTKHGEHESQSNEHRQSKIGIDKCWGRAAIACGATFFSSAAHANSGFFYVAFMREYGVNHEAASWPTSVFEALDQAGGAIAFAVFRGFAVSTIGMIGGVLVWTGILACLFAPDMTWMSITFGLIQGVGCGIVSMAVTVLLMMYFDKYRGVATGIRYTGYSLSSLIYPPVLALLEQVYSFRQLFLIFAGICLHVTPCLLALKEPPWSQKPAVVKNSRKQRTTDTSVESYQKYPHLQANANGMIKPKEFRNIPAYRMPIESNYRCDTVSGSSVCSSVKTPDANEMNCVNALEEYHQRSAEKLFMEDASSQVIPVKTKYICLKRIKAKSSSVGPKQLLDATPVADQWLKLACSNEKRDMNILLDIPAKASTIAPKDNEMFVWTTPQRKPTVHFSAPEKTPGDRKSLEAMSDLAETRRHCDMSMTPADVVHRSKIHKIDMAEKDESRSLIQLALKPSYWAVIMGAVLAEYTDCTFLATMVDSGLDRGATKLQGDLIITCSAPSQLVGRVLLPLLADVGLVSRTTLACVCYLSFAAVVTALGVTRSFATYSTFAAAASVLMGCLTTMKHVVTADYFGVDAVPAAWAATGAIVLPMLLSNPYIIGFFRDKQGSYDNLYYTLGFAHLFMGIIFLILRCSDSKRTRSWNVHSSEK